jgi:GH18 family chitinase
MKKRIFHIFFFLTFVLGIANQDALIGVQAYETYLESWDSRWHQVLTGLPPTPLNSPTRYDNVIVDIAFASYTFPGLNGVQFANPDADTHTVIDYVHSQNGKVKISYGGASYAGPNYFISKTEGWPNNIPTLVAGVTSVVTNYDFDGVDFDIEDSLPATSSAEEFADQLFNFLTQVRRALPNKIISLTIPAQGWGTYWKILAKKVAEARTVDYINFMEYDIWVGAPSYSAQIEADILTYTSPIGTFPAPNYSEGWGIAASLIQLGLMPGRDDTNRDLTLDDAKTLTHYAVSNGLVGVMTWDLNRDAGIIDPANPYKYSTAIREILSQIPLLGNVFLFPPPKQKHFIKSRKKARKLRPPFERQSPPLHGAPA